MPIVTGEMKKYVKKAKEDEERSERKKWLKVRRELDARDELILSGQEERLKQQEKVIQKEVEVQYQKYLLEESASEQEEERRRSLHLKKLREDFVLNRCKAVPDIRSNSGAKRVPTEEYLVSKQKFTIDRKEVSRGTFSRIYEGSDPNKRDVVVKVTLIKGLEKGYRIRYAAGFNILRYLKMRQDDVSSTVPNVDAPVKVNIVPIIELFQTPEKSYLFMERMAPHDLLYRIKHEAPFSPDVSLKWIRGILNGLLFLHSSGIAHENIKPESILFDSRSGSPRVASFGWAVVYYDPEKDSVVRQMGSSKQSFHHHLAPERLKDDPYDPSKADVWSLGILMVIMLTKEWPFEYKNKHRRDIQWKLVFKKNGVKLTEPFWSLLEKCFHEKPSSRPHLLDLLPDLITSGSSLGSKDTNGTTTTIPEGIQVIPSKSSKSSSSAPSVGVPLSPSPQSS